jgi:immune inhibitor A
MVATTVATADASTQKRVKPAATKTAGTPKSYSDNLPGGLQKQQAKLRKQALIQRLRGVPAAQKGIVKLGKKKFVDLENEGTDKIFTILVEFGDEQYTDASWPTTFQGPPPDESTADVTGPLHNQIPAPDRSVDNSTLWQADYNREHYEDMYFNRMKDYYETQSSGRYSIEGSVTEWVQVPFNEAFYGRNYCGSIVCATSPVLVRDALAVWVDTEIRSGKSLQEVTDFLKTFDQQDRYDINDNGVFDEPDGVIDHLQIVHAGGDEAAGDPNQGSDAIWSHRSRVQLQRAGSPLGVFAVQAGDAGSDRTVGNRFDNNSIPDHPTGVWAYDYTVQPENGGLGVFAHEFGHDLGLPDLYDTSGNTGGAENNTAFWTLMSSGANIGDGSPDGIGDAPTDMGAWERIQLGWLEPQNGKGPFYKTVEYGDSAAVELGPNTPVGTKPSALVVNLPPHEQDLGAPDSGDWMFWSGSGESFESTMTHAVSGGGTAVTARARYQIEEDWDYAYLEATTNGTEWTPLDTNLSREENPNDQNDGHGITGTTNGAWVDLTATAPADTTAIRFRYWTDPFTNGQGFFVDNITYGGQSIGTAETDEGWVFEHSWHGDPPGPGSFPQFSRTKQVVEGVTYPHFYIAENRQYDGYDTSLRTAYNFGFLGTRPDWVETHPYMTGLLVTYYDTQYTDNNVGDHPGHGQVLPVDAHPQFSHWPDDTLMRNRILSYDSTFGTDRTKALTLHLGRFDAEGEFVGTMTGRVPARAAVRTFDDTDTWWFASDEHSDATNNHPGRYQPGWYSVDVPKTGTVIHVNQVNKDKVKLTVNP